MVDLRNQHYPQRVSYADPLRQIAHDDREPVQKRKTQQGSKEPKILRPESIQCREDGDQSIYRKTGQQPLQVIAAKVRQRAFARRLGFEQARGASSFVDVVRIADDLARSRHSEQRAIPVAYWAINVHIATHDVGDHSVGISFTECPRALLIADAYVALDQFIDQVGRQIQSAEARAKDCEGVSILTAWIRFHSLARLLPFGHLGITPTREL